MNYINQNSIFLTTKTIKIQLFNNRPLTAVNTI